MKNKFRALIAAALLTAGLCSCKKTASAYPEYFQLSNGLSVFVKEDHKVPLAYIEIAARCGGVTQRRDNAGIFHLYEHMMFKGNSLCKDSAAFQKALAELGVDDWNGTTGEHCVNYFFTIPSEDLRKGMEFWSAAIREPLLDEAEFEAEKKVVISEIQAQYNSPGNILASFFTKTFYPNAPWQMDPSGAVQTVQEASLAELKSIKEKYYVPNNAALFVGGDVSLAQVKELAQEIFGGWQKGGFDFESERAVQDSAPFGQTKFFVFPNEQVSPQIAQTMVYYRGADADFDRDSTYPLDVWTKYINSPDSSFVKEILADQDLRIVSQDYVGGGYSTHRRTSTINFYAVMLEPERAIASRAKKFYSLVAEQIIPGSIASKEIVGRKKLGELKKIRRDEAAIKSELFQSVLGDARYWWTVCDKDYYYGYQKNLDKVGDADISRALQKYLQDKSAFVVVVVNPSVYKNFKADFDAQGFEEIKKEGAFWWESGSGN